MKKINLRSLRSKLIILCLIILVLPTLVIGISSYSISKNQLNDSGKTQLKNSAKMVIGMINLMNKEVEDGHITLEEAQEKIRQELLSEKDSKNQRSFNKEYTVGKTGYMWAVNQDAVSVMNPSNEGQNLIDVKSEDGVMIGKEFVEKGKKGGYVTYKWMNPATNKVETKVSYVEMDPHWGWIVGSGAYLSEFNNGASNVLFMISIIAIIAIIVGIIIVSIFSKRLTKPILLIGQELNRTAAGDFTGDEIDIKTKDEVGELAKDFNSMRQNMKQLITQVNSLTEQVAASSEQLTASAEQSSKATEEITESIQEVAAGAERSTVQLKESGQSLEEVTIAIQNIAENSAVISEAGAKTSDHAKQGREYIEKTVNQISTIERSVNESSKVLELLDRRSHEIGEISKVIINIANQTNLLALNAAIEAARAGEHGKGFAIVADEVRKLAEQSQQSSTQISELIKEIQVNMVRSTDSMNQVKIEVQGGLEIVGKTEVSFKDIVDSMEKIGANVNDMAATAEQLSASSQEVSATVNNITSLSKDASMHSQHVAASTEEQLASMEEISASANSLSILAGELQEHVSRFKL